MKYTILAFFRRIAAMLSALFLCVSGGGKPAAPVERPAPNTVTAYDAEAADYVLTADAQNELYDISDMLFGAFFEDINFAADGGLYAEMVANRSFEFTSLAAGDALFGWSSVNGAALSVVADDAAGALNANNPSYLVLENGGEAPAGAANRGFMEGMAVAENAVYRMSFYARGLSGYTGPVYACLLVGDETAAEAAVEGITDAWQKYEVELTAPVSAAGNVRAAVLIETGAAAFDMVSLFPADTFMGEENGLRKDLGELLLEMRPAFLRFPGGCVIEGESDETDYSWKDSVGADENGEPLLFSGRYGDVAARRQGLDLWTDLGASEDPYPSYMSYGLGFYEFFRLSEDLGAVPVPVINCGLYCQMRGKGPVDMESARFAEYVRDMLDLVEFANGSAVSKWGRVRADLGHPEPFGLKYIAVGNENEGPDYFERYAAFLDALHAAQAEDPALYGEIELIYSAGASDATHGANYIKSYEFAESWLAGHEGAGVSDFAAATDQHYYNDPEWFLQNTDYYDVGRYGRTAEEITATHYGGTIPVFVGEYAARSNTLKAALAEAAYMTALERNGDIVKMAAYAPLFGNVTASHWSPDLIWFNNSGAAPSVNYEVQKLFMNNTGARLVSSSLSGAAVPQANVTGRVGVGTWYTAAAFDNVKVSSLETGRTLDRDRFTLPDLFYKWELPTDGEFRVKGGRLVQSSTWMQYSNTGSVAYFGDPEWQNISFTVEAEKLEGEEGFLIAFGVADTENNFFWNLGGWQNTVSCLQQVKNGEKTGQIPGTVRPFSAETGRVYHLRVDINGRNVKCYVDDELYIDYTDGSDSEAEAYQVVSRAANGDLIVKLVNVTDSARSFAVSLSGGAGDTAAVTQLSGEDLAAVNAYGEEPACSVSSFELTGLSGAFNYTVPQYSVTVLRFPAQ